MDLTNNNFYTRFFKRKLERIFGVDFVNSLDVAGKFLPLVYACLMHRRITPVKRKVYIAKGVASSLLKDPKWEYLKSLVEQGKDINNHLSKNLFRWDKTDFLFYSCGIHHIHLHSSLKGGIRDDLIFAIVTNDSFYVIHRGTHHDIYQLGTLVQICDIEWPGLHFQIETDESNRLTQNDAAFIKNNACNHRMGYNLIRPATFIDKNNGKTKFVFNHVNTHLVSFEFDGNEKMLPLKCVTAFEDVNQLMFKISGQIHKCFGIIPDSLELDFENRLYIFKVPTFKGYGSYYLVKEIAPEYDTLCFPG